jgi:hypothetical protein
MTVTLKVMATSDGLSSTRSVKRERTSVPTDVGSVSLIAQASGQVEILEVFHLDNLLALS